MFGNCPWNIDSTVLMNSAAERQAQKRKIRNGQLPMPKLIKTANLASPSISDSLLPDTVGVSEDSDEREKPLELRKVCGHNSCLVSKNTALPLVEKDSRSDSAINAYNHCLFLSGISRRTSGSVSSCEHKNYNEIHDASTKTTTRSNNVCESFFIDLNDNALLRKIYLEEADGIVLTLGCSEHSRILTVVQNHRITFWESQSSVSEQLYSWYKKSSISISNGLVDDHRCENGLLLELGLHPSGWTSVVLVVDSNLLKCSVYGYEALGTTKVVDSVPKYLAFNNQKKLHSCLLGSSAIVIWWHNEDRGTTLKKIVLSDDLDELVAGNELAGTERNIQTLHHTDASTPIMMGTSEDYQLIIWNHISGQIIKSVDLSSSKIQSCIGIMEEKGFLFIIANVKPGSFQLLTINASKEYWRVIRTYSSGAVLGESISGYSINGRMLLAAYQNGITIWDMVEEIELCCIMPKRKFVPLVFSRDTVFMNEDHILYILDNSTIFKMQCNA